MPALDLGELGEQLAHGDVQGLLGGLVVEARRLQLHDLRLAAHPVEIEMGAPPDGAALQEATHVLAADRRQMLAETGAIESVEGVAMVPLFLGHAVEDLGGSGEVGAKAIREMLIDPRIFLFIGDRERDDLALGQFGQGLHSGSCLEIF